MARIERSIEVNVPVSLAYRELSQFEEFPRFMKGVHSVHQLDEAHLHWRAERDGREMEWDAEITEQIPEQCIAWRNTSGPRSEGRVLFEAMDSEKTRICLFIESAESTANQKEGTDDFVSQDEGDLARFKKMIESKKRVADPDEALAPHVAETAVKLARARIGAAPPGPQAWTPPVEIAQEAGRLQISTDLPGVNRQDVQIEVAHGQLTIEGQRRSGRGRNPQAQLHLQGERNYGRFFRAITLPAGVDPQSGEARMQDGVLEITFTIATAPDLVRRLEIQDK